MQLVILQPDIIKDMISQQPVMLVADLLAAGVYDWAIKANVDAGSWSVFTAVSSLPQRYGSSMPFSVDEIDALR